MVKNGSVSAASVQLTSAHCQAHHCQVRPIKVRSPSLGVLKGACQTQTSTWPHVAQVKRISGNGQEHSQSKIIISSSLHHLSKSDFRHHLILPVLISLSSLDLCFHSSPVVVIVKTILIFDTNLSNRKEDRRCSVV